MLTKVDKAEIPRLKTLPRGALRQFADETVAEFVATSKIGDIYEVTGAPKGNSKDPVTEATRLANALRSAIWYASLTDDVKQFRRSGRVFLERKQPRPQKVKPTPYRY